MKDTVIKETGNSRFLRSALPEGTSWEDALAMLIAGTFPIDLAGINAEGIETLGTAFSRATMLDDPAERAIWGNAADRTPAEAIVQLAPWRLIDTIDNTVGYSGEWEAPDVFGDGSAYDLGVYMIGGGASGTVNYFTDVCYGLGGASGEGKNTIINNVTPGAKYAWVIGKGGESVSKTGNTGSMSVASKAGGTTSFNGVTAAGGQAIARHSSTASLGGNGGQGSDAAGSSIAGNTRSVAPAGCMPTRGIYGNSSYHQGGATQSPREGQNQFDPSMVTLGAGGWAAGSTTNSKQSTPELTHGHAGAGSNSATGNSATGYGNGGGGVAKYNSTETSSGTYKSGAGSDGVIFLYARKAVS